MASSVIGALRVNLGLDSAKFSKGMTDAQKRLKVARTQFVAVAGAAAALAGGLSALTISTSRFAAEIKTMASVANAAPEELQRWAAGAATVGIEQEKLSDILKDVNDRVGDFVTTGGGPMADFFENVAPKIGITADAFKNLSGPQSLQLYVSSLEKAGLSQQEMTFYLEAMASDATALIPLLRNGGKEMDRLGDNAKSLGGVMSDKTMAATIGLKLAMADAGMAISGVGYRISGELAPALTVIATAFADAMREGRALREVIDFLIGNIDTITASVAVAVTGFGVRYVAAMVAATSATAVLTGALVALRVALVRSGIGLLVIGAAELVLWLGKVIKAADGVGDGFVRLYNVGKATFLGVGNTALGLMDILAGVASSIVGSFVAAFALIGKSFDALINGMAGAWNMLAESGVGGTLGLGTLGESNVGGAIQSSADALFGQAVDSINKGRQRVIDAGKGVADAVAASMKPMVDTDRMMEALLKGKKGLDDLGDDAGGGGGGGGKKGGGGESEAKKEADKTAAAIKALKTEYADLQATIGMTEQQQSVYNAIQSLGANATAGQRAEVEQLTLAIDGLKSRSERLKETFGEVRDSMKSAFVGLVTGAKTLKSAIGDLLGKFADMLASRAFDALWGSLGGGKGGGGGGWLGKIVDSMLGSIGANANGTNNWRGGLTQIHERGGEIMNLPRGTQIIPHDISKRMADGGGGGTYAPVYNIDARGTDVGVVQRLEQAVRKIDAQFEGRAINSFNIGKQRRLIT